VTSEIADIESLELATRHARTHSRDSGAPSHWLRCIHLREIDGRYFRCLLGDGHGGKHSFVDEAEHDLAASP
jgi:hypothetical protein